MTDLCLHNCRIFSRFTTPLDEAEIKAVRTACALRRADRFTALAATAVKGSSGPPFPDHFPAATGLLTVSAFGPHKTVFATLDDILDYPEDQILPVRFSHSVHNAAAAYLGTILGLTGPAFAVTGFESPLFEALELARTLLRANACPQILLLAIEEQGCLTRIAPTLDPRRFPDEPEEIVCAMRLSLVPDPDSRTITLSRPATGRPEPACTLGLSRDIIAQLARTGCREPIRL